MLDHHLQRSIVYRLALEQGLRFSELQPAEVENKLFTYHLKKVMTAGFVEKTDTGVYQLTSEGRRLGVRVLEDSATAAAKAHSILFLVIQRKSDGAWLLYKRSVHPLKGRIGFMHASPSSVLDSVTAAHQECLQKTGLSCRFTALGGGYFRVYQKNQLESFTHFTLLICKDPQGELLPDHAHAGYFWQLEPDFAESTMLPNMPTLVRLYRKNQPFFIEETLNVS